MNEVIQVIEDYVEKRITVDEFCSRFIGLWCELRDEQDERVRNNLLFKHREKEIYNLFSKKIISDVDLHQQLAVLWREIPNVRLRPFTEESRIITDLHGDANAYCPECEPWTGHDMSEEELYESARNALEQLRALRYNAT